MTGNPKWLCFNLKKNTHAVLLKSRIQTQECGEADSNGVLKKEIDVSEKIEFAGL